MGMFKDLRSMRKQANEMLPPEHRGLVGGVRAMKDGMAKLSETMAAMNAQNGQYKTLMETGIAGQATITSIADTGATINDNPQVRLGLQVELPDRPVYDATVTQLVSRLSVSNFQPGAVVPVRVSPDDPQVLMIG